MGPRRIIGHLGQERQDDRLAFRGPVVQDVYHRLHQLGIRDRRRGEVQHAALIVLVDVAHGVAHLLVRVERQPERREREFRVPGAAQRAAGLQHVDLHVSVSALETRDQRFFKLGARAAEEVDQVAVIAHARLIEAVAHVVLEGRGLAVGRVLVPRPVEVGNA